ncbi:MAG TPA: DEAD/DEAH box helicase [Spirochaetota bacterium]|nr:DEAD/DEAH box helicase [Spirochaetota bacterium]HOK92885.1 DEAD/DEAH box helicase [Spirochaetota bacterium]HPP94983.1 DEAD/DEAH box helicase [Spirochaetota bacterium]HRS62267.1 DEAD/DEAH box helicase [Spirochaetota bacterium]
MDSLTFTELGLSEDILKELTKRGFEEPTEIQRKIIPILLKEETDIIGQAQTGTGKTAAFGLPLLEKIKKSEKFPQVLILTPTRELAIQVSEELNSFKGKKKLTIFPIYGGQSINEQIRRIEKGIDIIVGTPGRIIDHIKRGTLFLHNIRYVVLDEADEMLNMGFIEEVEEILQNINPEKNIYLFSATMPEQIMAIAKKYMKSYKVISTKNIQLTTDLTEQIYFEVRESDRFEALCRIIDIEEDFYGLIFCRTKVDVDDLTNRLIDRGYSVEGLHGDISQHQRERTLTKFKKKKINILVATDVAARGIDVTNLSHVINYSLPQEPEAYIHRIGRTGRAGKKGIAITFISPSEYKKLLFIQKIAKTTIKKEKVPAIEDVINSKKLRIKREIESIIEQGTQKEYLKISSAILKENNAEDIIAAMIKFAFERDLDERRYGEISEASVDSKGTTRLFLSFGRKDDITPRKLIKLIKEKTGIDSNKITDIKVMDSFSFITVPFEDAGKLIKNFPKEIGGKQGSIQKAKETKPEVKQKRKSKK